jgi:hypothetical protein
MRTVLLALTILSSAATLRAQELTANDTSAILAAVLNEYRTSNGPIVQIARTVACGDPRYTGPARLAENRPCRSMAIDSVLSRYAAAHEVELVDVGADVPTCRWSEDDSTERRGLRLDLMAPDAVEGQVRAGILVRCRATVRGMARGFAHGVRYEVKKEGEVWRVTRVLSSMIT